MERSPIDDLPFIDEHSVEVERGPADVWDALVGGADRAFSGPRNAQVAKLLGCAEVAPGGPRPLAVGSTFPGFRVVVAEPQQTLALAGRHRFSHYALVFQIDELGPSRSRVRAVTRAAFPGLQGRVYRTLVIGTKGHVVAVRRLLGAVQRRAERAPAAS